MAWPGIPSHTLLAFLGLLLTGCVAGPATEPDIDTSDITSMSTFPAKPADGEKAAEPAWGIAHVSAKLPELRVQGRVDSAVSGGGGSAKILVVESAFYRTTEGFQAVLDGAPSVEHSREIAWREKALTEGGAFDVLLTQWHRYIGFPVTFDTKADFSKKPDRAVTHGRILFFRFEGSDLVYRVTIEESGALIDEVNLAAALGANFQYQDEVAWQRSTAIRVSKLVRSESRDYLAVIISRR